MHYLIALLLALLSLLVVSYPLLKSRRHASKPQSPSDSNDSHTQNIEDTFDEIDRLQLEFELGVIEPDDYQRQMNELRRAAAQSLRAYEQSLGSTNDSPTPNDMDALLEERIRLHRRTLRNNNGESR